MRRLARLFLCLIALTTNAQAGARADAAALVATGTPAGFDALASSRVSLVDIYFGDRKIAEALADTRPGLLRFRTPADVLAALPGVNAAPQLEALLAGELPTNSSALCSLAKTTGCGVLEPAVLGIIYDEDRFRVDIFINPRFLRTSGAGGGDFLPVPTAPLSLTSAFGLAASGAVGGRSTVNLQNRTVLGLGGARIRTSNALASRLGWIVDDFVGEIDRKDLRYSAGLFWAPGTDVIGERRMIGVGVGTQFDTRADSNAIRGTPLVLFLPQPARVEILADGRLVSSRSYEAGKTELDTSGLADGSYSLLLRIHERNGSVREERRFFIKNASVPPVDHPVYFAYAGVLANTRAHRPVDPSRTLFFQAGARWRLSNSLALDADVLGTDTKAIVELGGWLLERPARVRLAALGSTAGDAGILVQFASSAHGALTLDFDLRRIWSADGRPLIPLPDHVDSFGTDQPIGAQLASGSYTQAVGSVGLRLGGGNLSVVASYRKDARLKSDYSIGPSLNWPVVTRNGVQLMFDVSGQRTRSSTAAFAGVRILSTSGPVSVTGTAGASVEDDGSRGDGATGRSTGSVAVQYSRDTAGGAVVTADVGAERDIRSSAVHAGGTLSSPLGNARADLFHGLEGRSGTQYDLSFQSAVAISAHSASFGGRQTEPSAIIVSVHGDAPDALFDVIVDGAPRGEVRSGQKLSLFVPAYRTYRVRLVQAEAVPVDYDTATRDVTLYPGNVQTLDWTAQSYFTLIAQAVSADGSPMVNALVQSRKGIAETDSSGFFQLDMRTGDAITIEGNGGSCAVALPKFVVQNDFAAVGKVICK